MPSAPDSRSASAYAHMYEYDLGEFAWEYLRRNPDYQQDYRAAVRRAEQTGGKDSCSLGTALSLSIRSCRQTPLHSSGCRSLIRPRFSSSRQQNPSLVHARFAP